MTDLSKQIQAVNMDPVIRHSEKEIGTFLHDNRFNFKVDAIDYSNEDITYSIHKRRDVAYDVDPMIQNYLMHKMVHSDWTNY